MKFGDVETGIPISPILGESLGGKLRELMKKLSVGDSFLIQFDKNSTDKKDVARLSSRICQTSRQLGIKAVRRTLPEGIRVWRVEKGE